jgi:predicted nucleic acid-binding protein
MASKVFLDANIMLDFTLKRAEFEQSRKIIELAVNGTIQAFITPSIIHIVSIWLTKAYGNAKAKELLLTLMADVNVIDLPHEIVLNALHSKITDIEDALQYYTAVHHKLDYFISRDKQLQKQGIPVLPVYTPKELLIEIAE